MSKYALAKSWDGQNITTDYSKSLINIKFSFVKPQTILKTIFIITIFSIILNSMFKPFGGNQEPVSTITNVSQLPNVNDNNVHGQIDLIRGLE